MRNIIILFIIAILISSNQTLADNHLRNDALFKDIFTTFPQDENGYSIITPQKNSRLIYVSSSDGDDKSARAYSLKEINQPRNPIEKITPFKTIDKAIKLQRANHSDWLLLKKGDEWQLKKTLSLPSGKSALSPLVITSYGESKKRPLINTGVQSGIKLTKSRSFIALIGIELYANQRDPASSEFIGWDKIGTPGGFISVAGNKAVHSIYLEDNKFGFFSNNLQFNGSARHKNIIIRKNIILNSYSTHSHSQGLFSSNSSILLEENIFDHNGWYQQNYEKLNSKNKGQATFFNHNAYLANMNNTIIKNNIFSRPSSIGLKLTANPTQQNTVMAENIIIDNNFFSEGEIGISAGGNTDFQNGYRWKNITITNNVMINIGNNQPTRRNLAWHIEANDWNTGVIKNNYLLCNVNPAVTNVSGIKVSGNTYNVEVESNVLYGLKSAEKKLIYQTPKEIKKNLSFSNNYLVKNKMKLCQSLQRLAVKNKADNINTFIDKSKEMSIDNWEASYSAIGINNTVRSLFGPNYLKY